MVFLYKLLDEKTYELLRREQLLSFSRPFFVFKSERKVFRLLREIIEKISKKESKKPPCSWCKDGKLIKLAEEWIQEYRESMLGKYGEHYSDADVRSDLHIILTQYFQMYCGYFTSTDLDNPQIREQYIEDNPTLFRNKETQKTHYVKISIYPKYFTEEVWVSKKEDLSKFYYTSNERDKRVYGGIKSTLYMHGVEYASHDKLVKPFETFNGKDKRKLSSFLKYVSSNYNKQNEVRLMLYLPGPCPNNNTSSFTPSPMCYRAESFAQQMVHDVVDFYQQALEYPENVYLHIKEYSAGHI